jgi:hypothetical protein
MIQILSTITDSISAWLIALPAASIVAYSFIALFVIASLVALIVDRAILIGRAIREKATRWHARMILRDGLIRFKQRHDHGAGIAVWIVTGIIAILTVAIVRKCGWAR